MLVFIRASSFGNGSKHRTPAVILVSIFARELYLEENRTVYLKLKLQPAIGHMSYRSNMTSAQS